VEPDPAALARQLRRKEGLGSDKSAVLSRIIDLNYE
jgi:hypothetical protein